MRSQGIKIKKISRLYETQPMYYENQDAFLNGVVVIETSLQPLELLDVLQQIELEQGRRRDIEKGPRTLDLDVILYGDDHIDHDRLKVPHPLMLEREFVLRPLLDVLPEHNMLTPAPTLTDSPAQTQVSIKDALSKISSPDETMYPVTCLSGKSPLMVPASARPTSRTLVMAILNITPDSFSDGGDLTTHGSEFVAHYAEKVIHDGATILDIGGQSTRPGAQLISAEEELARILPGLEAIRSVPSVSSGQVLVSVDTFYASVARGTYDKDMLSTAAELKKPIILMHMRGTPQTMGRSHFHDYTSLGGVVPGVAKELAFRVEAALEAGITPWRIMLDPGLGFAKSAMGSIQLLRAGPVGLVTAEPRLGGYPWLIGPSRKGFIGRATGIVMANSRDHATCACITTAIATGADVVRVHDVRSMVQAGKMADTIFRDVLSADLQKDVDMARKGSEKSQENV
ncbi:trifunctional dihydropteroate synthetase [Lithohypha guttulata]|uniref:trifunctional dihydropteroate synthetase n=1 Tax=Lithohypha guttulata TaxID=1690604 RepID=UPI002DE063EA|nr:trifunctional dihydropteroate synthetase [Lithohypha guttulata]KAK5105018.1 trifunctional dihydropteroate synthetase [Lithohypha guttulata]